MPSLINTKRISTDTILYIPVFLAPAVINIVLLMVFTRYFSPKEYGSYTIVVNTSIILSSFLAQWIVLSTQRYRPEFMKIGTIREFNRNINHLLFYISAGFLLSASVLFLFLPPILEGYRSYYWSTVLLIISSIYSMVYGGIYQVDLQTKKYRNLNVIQSILKLLIIFVLVFYIWFQPVSFVWGTVLAQLLVLLPMLRYVDTHKMFQPQNAGADSFYDFVKKFWTYGFPLIGWYIGTTILNLTDRYMLEYYRTAHEVGIYSANFTIAVQAIALICNPVFFAVQPLIMNEIQKNKDKEHIEQRISGFTGLFLVISIPFGVYFSIFRKEVSELLLGSQFTSGAAIIPILIIGFFAWNIGLYGQLLYQIGERTKEMFYFVTAAAVFNFLLNLYFIPKWGFVGAAISTTLGFILYSLLLLVFSKKFIEWKIPWRTLLNVTSAVILCSIPILIIKVNLLTNAHPIVSMMAGLLFFVFYVTWIYFYGKKYLKFLKLE